MHFLSRISFNSSGWQRPTGEAGKLEDEASFNVVFGFGLEDWLFRGEWQLDGWRYSFLQGVNKQGKAYVGKPLDLTLYTVLADKRRRFVANLYEVECLSDLQADEACEEFRGNGWLRQMEDDISGVSGNPSALNANRYTSYPLNVRFRSTNVDPFPTDKVIVADTWLNHRRRYKLYHLEEPQRQHLETLLRNAPGQQSPLDARPIFRKGVAPVLCSPEHRRMQASLLTALQAEYGMENVRIEVDGVDVMVETKDETRIYEIKSDINPRTVIRQALGQILEYAYHPPRIHRSPVRLLIVGRCRLGADEQTYLNHLKTAFNLPIEYLPLPD